MIFKSRRSSASTSRASRTTRQMMMTWKEEQEAMRGGRGLLHSQEPRECPVGSLGNTSALRSHSLSHSLSLDHQSVSPVPALKANPTLKRQIEFLSFLFYFCGSLLLGYTQNRCSISYLTHPSLGTLSSRRDTAPPPLSPRRSCLSSGSGVAKQAHPSV